MAQPTVSILIPCLNEKNTINAVIKDAQKHARAIFRNSFEIVVVDNGSTDGSLDIIKQFSTVHLINAPIKGYGAALHWGILHSKGKYVLFADADMSYPFSNLVKFKKVMNDNPDLILGSRLKGSIQKDAMPFLHRYLGTPILTALIRFIYGIPTTDCNSGMRSVKRSFYNKLNMRNSGMEWASELLIKTALNKGSYREVPIRFMKDKRQKAPHLSSWSDGWRHLKAIFLLKPQSIYPFIFLLLLLSAITYPIDLGIFFLLINLVIVLIFSLIAIIFLNSIIEKKYNQLTQFMLNFKLVPITAIVSFIALIGMLVLPFQYQTIKLIIASFLGILIMWIFLVETIKTHLVNRLPESS